MDEREIVGDPTVADLMRTDVPTLDREDSIAIVAARLAESGLPGLPVVANGEVVGIVAELDLIARQAEVTVPTTVPFFDAIFVADGGRDFEEDLRHVLATTADDLMTSPVYNILASATLSQLATLMLEQGVNPVPVVDDAHALVGIVSRADLVRVIARMERSPEATGSGGGDDGP